jgi:hypothetical protein
VEEKPSLNAKNWLNLFFYVFNIVFPFGVSTFNWFGGETNSNLSLMYPVCGFLFPLVQEPLAILLSHFHSTFIIDSRDSKGYCLSHLERPFHLSIALLHPSILA